MDAKLKEKINLILKEGIRSYNETQLLVPEILNDESMALIVLNYYDSLPEHHERSISLNVFGPDVINNPLFLQAYFKKARNPDDYQYITTDLLDNKMFLTQILTTNPDVFLQSSDRLKNDEVLLSFIERNQRFYLKYMPESLRDDEQYVSQALQYHYDNFPYASERLKTNSFYYKRPLEQNEDNAQYLPTEYLNSHIHELLNINGNILKHASKKSQSDEETVKIAIKQNFCAFTYASLKLRGNIDIINLTLNEIKRKTNNNLSMSSNNPVVSIPYHIYDNQEFVNQHRDILNNCYEDLLPKVRNHPNILMAVFSHEKEINFSNINLVGNKEIKQGLKPIAKMKDGQKHIHASKFLSMFYLNHKLHSELDIQEITEPIKKIKI